jgi:hypothetical protein
MYLRPAKLSSEYNLLPHLPLDQGLWNRLFPYLFLFVSRREDLMLNQSHALQFLQSNTRINRK